MKFEDILNHHKDNIYLWWWEKVKLFAGIWIDWIIYEFVIDSHTSQSKKISLSSLLSPDSWFLQSCKWDTNGESILRDYEFVQDEEANPWIDAKWCYDDDEWQYHAMKLSVLSLMAQKKYIEDNVIID